MTETKQSVKTVSWLPWFWPLALAGAVVFASGGNPQSPVSFIGVDKVAHFGVFGLLATLLLRTPQVWRRVGWRGWIAVLAVSAFGGTDEWHQSFTPGRSVEFGDWLSDTTGAALAVALYLNWAWYRRLLEFSFPRRRKTAGEKTKPEAPATVASGACEPAEV
jgi:VanZ family protein